MKRKVINYKKVLVILILCLGLIAGLFPSIQTQAAYDVKLAEDIHKATVLLESILEQQYKDIEEKLKETIMEKSYDYTLTMESFYQTGNPYRELDYLSLIATYVSIKDYCNTHGIPVGEGIAGAEFLSLSIEEHSFIESIPILVENYKEIEEGIFVRDGNQVIENKGIIGIYESIDGDIYRLVGEQTVEPKEQTITYAKVTLSCLGEDALYSLYGILPEEIKEDRDNRLLKLKTQTSNEALLQSVFIQTPESMEVLSEEVRKKIDELVAPLEGTERLLVETALSLVGKVPYQWGGKPRQAGYDTSWWLFDEKGEQRGLDCSGFVEWTYLTAGFDAETVKLVSSSWNMMAIPDTPYYELRPGDIGILNHNENNEPNHLGIYLGEGYFIHCASGAGTVTVSEFPFTYFKKVQKNVDTEGKVTYSENKNYTNSIYENKNYTNSKNEIASEEDIYLLGQLLMHEAGNQGYNGMVAVAEVVKNRVESEKFEQSTVREVIYAKEQFSFVERISSIVPSEEALSIARMVLNGQLVLFNNKDVLYFKNPKITDGIEPNVPVNWGKCVWYTAINDHAFYLG